MKIAARILFVLYIAVMLFLCLTQVPTITPLKFNFHFVPSDKMLHWLMFIPFPILTYLGFHKQTGKLLRLMVFTLISTTLAASLAWGIEELQGLVGYRSKDVLDFMADLAGIGTGLLPVLTYAVASNKF